MVTGKARITQFGLVALLVGGAIAAWSAASPRAAAGDSKDTQVKKLLREKVATLKEIAATVNKIYQRGDYSLDQVYLANLAVHRAELDLCDSDKERIPILEKMLEDAKAQEKAVLSAIGWMATDTPILHAKVDRLNIEIALERARAAEHANSTGQ